MSDDVNSSCDKNSKRRQEQDGGKESIYLGPVQISDEDNEWNKRALKIAAKELQAVSVAVS